METNIYERENLKEFLEEAELNQYYELFRDILKVTKVSQLKFVVSEDLSHIGLSKPEQRRYKKIYSKYFPNPYLSKFKKLLTPHKKIENYHPAHSSMGIEFQPFSENSVKVPTKHIISIEDITINKELGMGQFGVVQQGTWTTGNQRLQVAIKCLGNERMTSNSTEFLKEAAVMHSIEHPNIVRLYGVVLHMESLMLVTELAPLRSLLECIREVSLRPNFPVTNLCEFAEQICDGMAYLENKRLIHRDLAARNILVFNKDKVKISDFGLSRALGVGKDYYRTNYNVNLKLPVAWCAPECILYLRFTSSSDVWAFGVCLWEMFTYGFQPWAAFSGQQILEAIDAPNYQRLERPECCPEGYYNLMLTCWSHNPDLRPNFKDLCSKLPTLKPEQVVTTVAYRKVEEGRRSNFLNYQAGDVIIVLGKEQLTRSSMWYGVTPGGACGMFDPCNTKLYSVTEPPRQIVTPYKPSEDLEQVPLINPNSPSHLTATSCTSPYPLLTTNRKDVSDDEVHVYDPKVRNKKKPNLKLEPPSRGILSKVKSATLGRSHKSEDKNPSKVDELHEYHEISDADTESYVTDNAKIDMVMLPESPGIPRCYGDFSQSIFDEMESMFKSLDGKGRREDTKAGLSKYMESDPAARSLTLSKSERKKHLNSGTMKPMSAHDEKTLATAVAMANEITSKSMTDLGNKLPSSLNERSKYNIKMPLAGHNAAPENDKEMSCKPERRNFSEEANRVPDIQSSLTEEGKLAYISLIDDPTPSTSLTSHIAKETGMYKPPYAPKPALRAAESKQLLKPGPKSKPKASLPVNHYDDIYNSLPLPPRTTKPKLVDKPRHVRKYPLKMKENENVERNQVSVADSIVKKPVIYQNTVNINMPERVIPKFTKKESGVDVFDGVERVRVGTNPFKQDTASANPFNHYLDMENFKDNEYVSLEDQLNERSLVKEHVSVEDLLEFADHIPCGKQRGVESDEVRIMSKVLKQQVTPGECLGALELADWNVHKAIKIVRVKLAVGPEATLGNCNVQLANADGDIAKASALLMLNKN